MNEIWKTTKNKFAVFAEDPTKVMETTHNPSKMEDVATSATQREYYPLESMQSSE